MTYLTVSPGETMSKILLNNCNLIDGTGREVQDSVWILIDGEKIVKIGHGAKKPTSEFEEIDLDGSYVLPGLINLHVHVQRRNLHYKDQKGSFKQRAAVIAQSSESRRMLLSLKNAWDELQHGCTTIRDVSSKDRLTNTLRDCINDEIFLGPRILACGYGIACTGGHGTHAFNDSIEANGADGFRKAVRYEIKQGADLIKFKGSGGLGSMPKEHPYWSELTYEELKAGIDEAHNRGKSTTIHMMSNKAAKIALKAGIDGIEHGTCLDEEILTMMRERNVYYVPTMSGITGVAEREMESGNPKIAEIMFRDVVWPQRESVRFAHKEGIRIGCGTDTQGDILIEMNLMNECGMTTMDCIKSATSTAAEICGLEHDIGTIEVGKTADILVVRENPLNNLNALTQIRLVLKNGQCVNSDWMCNLSNWQ